MKCISKENRDYALGENRWGIDGWTEEKKAGAAALPLTYICLFVVLDEFSELKVPGDNGDLE